MADVAARTARLLGRPAASAVRLQGGDLSQVWRIDLGAGQSVVAKTGTPAAAEAAMLRAIANAGAPAPAVLALAGDLLVMEDLGSDEGLQTGPAGGAWGDLGRVLAQLHAAIADGYGWAEDHAFGPVRIENAALADWPEFWAVRRLLPCCHALSADLARRVERLAARLPALLPRHPPAALLHGDLWTGNIVARGGRVTGLIDPACHHGHAEVDLAMLTLFARPAPAFWESYGQAEAAGAARRPLYQLWPALVHLRLFGAAYRNLVERCLTAAEAM